MDVRIFVFRYIMYTHFFEINVNLYVPNNQNLVHKTFKLFNFNVVSAHMITSWHHCDVASKGGRKT